MTDFNRGIMKFKNADSPLSIALSSIVVLSAIGFLLWWGFQTAYV
jgi:lysozyme family protein